MINTINTNLLKEKLLLIYKENTVKKNYNTTHCIVKVNTRLSNITISLVTLKGNTLAWANGGAIQSKRTRMSSRCINDLVVQFLTKSKTQRNPFSYFKLQFCGPSKRFRRKIFNKLKRKINFYCEEEAFNKTFNGCRLPRPRR